MLKKIFDNFNTLAYNYGQLESMEKWECIDQHMNEIPWYTYPSIEYLNNLDFSKKVVFEYGSGNSSLFWAKRSKEVTSVEDDEIWFSKMNNIRLQNQNLILSKNSNLYENTISNLNQKFDVIIIDGKRRIKCAEKIYKYLNTESTDGCMVILDNSDWYKNTAKYLKEKLNLIQIDFHGFGPINNYTWTTSIFISRNFDFKAKKQIQPISSIGSIQNHSEELEILKYHIEKHLSKNDKFVIYGFGLLGRNIYQGLKDNFNITNIIDNRQNNNRIDNLIIKDKNNYSYKKEYIVITVLNPLEIDKIVEELKNKYQIMENKIIICSNLIKKYFDDMNCRFKKNQNYELKTYAQDSEDTILKRIFESRNLYEGGFYVDVGAHHPIKYSNTYFLYKKGWRGINIDAMPGSMNEFNLIRPEDINLEYAVSDKEEILTYYQFNEPALNSFDKILSSTRNMKKNYSIISTQKIQTVRLDFLLDTYLPKNQNIDFLSIDVEGLDFKVLKSNNWGKYRPKVVLVEVLFHDIDDMIDSDLYKFMKNLNYKYFAKTVGTHFFIQDNFLTQKRTNE